MICERQRGNKKRHLEFQIVLSRGLCQVMIGSVFGRFGMESTQANQEKAALLRVARRRLQSGARLNCMYPINFMAKA